MASVNRYTNLSTTQFNPLSIEELSIVPMAMRQKHDAANAQLENTRMQMNSLVDSLPQHDERAKAIVAEMNSLIDSQSEKLSRSGYTNLTSSNMIKLNRDYQNLMSPNGELGRINAAKKDYAEKYKQYVESGQKQGWDLDKINANWARHSSKYFGYDSNGNVTNIGLAGSPEKYDVADFAKEFTTNIGHVKRRLDSMGGGRIGIGPSGTVAVYNQDGSVHQMTNSPQIQQLQQLAQSIFLTPGGKGFESAMYAGKDLMSLRNEFESMLNSKVIDEVTDTRNSKLSLHNLPKSGDGGDGAGGTLSNIVSANTITGRVGAEYTRDLGTVNGRINALSKIEGRSTSQEAELESLMKMRQDTELTLNNSKEYQDARKEYNKIAKERKLPEYSRQLDISEIKSKPQVSMEDDPKLRAYQMAKAMDGPSDAKLVELAKKMRNIEKDSFKANANPIQSDLYLIADTGKSGDTANLRGLNNTFARVLKSGAFATGNNVDIMSISYGNQTRGQGGTFDNADKEEIQKVINGTSTSDINLVGVRPVGTSSKVEYVIEINPQKGNKANLNRWFRGESGSGTIGDGKSFQISVVANTLSNNSDMRNIAGFTVDYLNKQGPEGNKVANAIINNMSRSNMNTTFRTSGASGKRVTYKEFSDNPTQFYSNPEELKEVYKIMNNDAFKSQYQTGYFGNKPLDKITDREINQAIEDYYKVNANKEIINW